MWWANNGKNRLVCKISSVRMGWDESQYQYIWEQLTRGARQVQAYRITLFAASALGEKQLVELVDMHKDGCS